MTTPDPIPLAEIEAACEAAVIALGEACGRGKLTMSIPASRLDHDIVISGALGWVPAMAAEIRRLRSQLARYEAGPEFFDIEPLEDHNTLTARDVREMQNNAKRLRGDREGGPEQIVLEPYEVVVSRSEYVAMANTVAADRAAVAKWSEECRRKDEDIARLRAEDKPRPLTDWHHDDGNVLCFTEPIDEPPYCGTPTDDEFPWVSTPHEDILFVPLPRIFREATP